MDAHMKRSMKHEESDPLYPIYTFMDSDMSGTAENGKRDLAEIVGNKHGLDTVKPVLLMKYLCATFSSNNDIILDFFAGSCTIAQAIFELNLENNVKRKYIVVQLPEKIKENSEAFTVGGFKTISDIGKRRLRNFIKKIKSENKQLKTNKNTDIDLGFKFFKMTKSNFKVWENYEGKDAKALQKQLKLFKMSLVDDYDVVDVIYECIIKEGYNLNSIITKCDLTQNSIYKVKYNDAFFYVCMDKEIKSQSIDALDMTKEDILFCTDTALTDTMKINLTKQCNLKTL